MKMVMGYGRRIRCAHWALVLLEQVTSSFDYLRTVKVNQIIRFVQNCCDCFLVISGNKGAGVGFEPTTSWL